MKKQFVMILAIMVAGITTTYAQGGGGGRMSVEERVTRVHAKLDSAFKLEAAKLTQADSAFAEYYRAQNAKLSEMMAGGNRPDREAMQAAMKPMVEARDAKLKTILTEAQFKTFKDEIEPALRPRGGGGGGGRNNNR